MNPQLYPVRARRRLKVSVHQITQKSGRKVAQDCGADVMFGTLLWAVREAWARDRRLDPGGARPACIGLLYGAAKSGACDSGDTDVVMLPATRWRERLAAALRAARDATDPVYPFAAKGFSRGKSVVVSIPHTVMRVRGRDLVHDEGRTLRVCALADYIGRELRQQPNRFHPEARWIEEVRIVVTSRGFGIDVWYGFQRERGSHWQLYNENRDDGGPSWFVRPIFGETLAQFLDRAHTALSAATVEVAEVPWSVWRINSELRGQIPQGYVFAPTEERALACWLRHEAPRTSLVAPEVAMGSGPVASLPLGDVWREGAVRLSQEAGAPELGFRSTAYRIEVATAQTLLRMSGAPYRSAVEKFHGGWILPDDGAST